MTERVCATTDPTYYEEHSESLELWTPGNPLFSSPEFTTAIRDRAVAETLKEVLDG